MYAGASLHFDADSTCLDAANQTKAEIKTAMENGSFNDLESRIVNVAYVEESDLDFSSIDPIGGNTSTNRSESRLPGYAWALIGLAATAVLLTVVVVWKRRRQQSRGENMAYVMYCEPSISTDNNWYDEGRSQPSEQSRDAAALHDGKLLPKMESDEDEKDDAVLSPKVETVTSQDSNDEEAVLPPKVETVTSQDDDESMKDYPSKKEQLLQDYVIDNEDVAPLSEIQFVPRMQDTSGEDTSDEDDDDDDEESSSNETEKHMN